MPHWLSVTNVLIRQAVSGTCWVPSLGELDLRQRLKLGIAGAELCGRGVEETVPSHIASEGGNCQEEKQIMWTKERDTKRSCGRWNWRSRRRNGAGTGSLRKNPWGEIRHTR